jgi:hypothetical protein
MNIAPFVRLSLVGAMLVASGLGCKPDPVSVKLNRFREYALKKGFNVDQHRAELALSKWQNGRLDSEPILLCATLSKTVGRETKNLSFFTFDEDMDIVGFGILEEYTDANGLRTALTEEYDTTGKGPYPPDEPVQGFGFIVQIRDAGQRKDVQRWNEYLKAKSGDVNAARDLTPAGKTSPVMPPIWISIPESNRVDVYVYVYDRQGHKSDRIRVRNLIPPREKGI